jgi:uncharacterized protein
MAQATSILAARINVPAERIAEFCRRWKIAELSLFGSVLREDFSAASDIDVLVEFSPEAAWSLYDWVDMGEELSVLFGRRADLVSKRGLRNPYRREAILGSREIIYAA